MRPTRALNLMAIVAMAAGLGACNMVVTSEPSFTTADAAGAPALKEGLWASRDPACEADLSKPMADWPECASGVEFSGGAFRGQDKDGKSYAIPVVLAAGDPRILQVKIEDDKPPEGGTVPNAIYLYVGVEPLKSDKAGKIIRYRAWSVQCGPPPPEGTKGPTGEMRYGTLEPLPGMTLDAEQSGCTPADKAALTAAAKVSRSYGPSDERVSEWVRAKGP